MFFLTGFKAHADGVRSADEGETVHELEEVGLLELRAEVAHTDGLVAADIHDGNAAGVGAGSGNALEAEIRSGGFAGGSLFEGGVGAGEAEAEEVDDGGRDGARPGGADVVVGIELRALVATAAIGDAGNDALAEDVLAMVAPAGGEDVFGAEVVVGLEVALVSVLVARALDAVVLDGLPGGGDGAREIGGGIEVEDLLAQRVKGALRDGAVGKRGAGGGIGDVLVEGAVVLGVGRDGHQELIGEVLDEALVVGEVEEFVLDEGAAEGAAELVPVEVGLGRADQVGGPGCGGEFLVAVVIPGGAVRADWCPT